MSVASTGELAERELRTRVAEILNRRPAAGLAVAVIRNGSPAWFHGRGVADIASSTPVTEDTVERGLAIVRAPSRGATCVYG